MVAEVLACLRPAPGEFVLDCTLGAGGHARALLPRIAPGGRLLGLDVDPVELPRTTDALRKAGFGADVCATHLGSFAELDTALRFVGDVKADVVLADLGVSAMQFDAPSRGFSYKVVGPLDMRMDPTRGVPAAELLARTDLPSLARLLAENADEPHARLIADALADAKPSTTHAAERFVRAALVRAFPDMPRSAVKQSIRRTFQALRIAVNDEFAALERFLDILPRCLAPGGRVAVLTFHSGEDRRVKQAFRAGLRSGVYAATNDRVVRSGKVETFSNRRASAAKLRWAVRAQYE